MSTEPESGIPRLTQPRGDRDERYYVSTLRGKHRLYRRYRGADGVWHNQVLPITDDDLTTAEGAMRAKQIWKRELITYPCHWCGRPIEMTRDELRFMSVQMLARYSIGALPTCSKECADSLVEFYNKHKDKVIDQSAPVKRYGR